MQITNSQISINHMYSLSKLHHNPSHNLACPLARVFLQMAILFLGARLIELDAKVE